MALLILRRAAQCGGVNPAIRVRAMTTVCMNAHPTEWLRESPEIWRKCGSVSNGFTIKVNAPGLARAIWPKLGETRQNLDVKAAKMDRVGLSAQ